jgi:hypothetical protein
MIGLIIDTFFTTPRMALDEVVFLGIVTAALAGLITWVGLRQVVTSMELRAGAIEHASGDVVWTGGRFRSSLLERSLALPWDGLGPGSYQFYYLPRLGLVVSAEVLQQNTPAQQVDLLNTAFAQILKFNPEALADFRTGSLGIDRGPQLRMAWSAPGWELLATLVVFVIFVAAVNLYPTSQVNDVLCVANLAAAGFFLVAAYGSLRRTIDLWGGQVLTVEGAVKKQKFSGARSSSYYYHLGNLTFEVPVAAYHAMLEGQHCRLYYLPRTRRLIALEALV